MHACRLNYLIRRKNGYHDNKKIPIGLIYRIPFVKRTFDILTAGAALIALSPIMLIVAILIKLDSKGPVVYSSRRVGSGYKVFDFYKFRSMKPEADTMVDNMTHLNQYGPKAQKDFAECQECNKLGRPCSPILVIDDGEDICENLYLSRKGATSKSFVKFIDDPRITRLGSFIRKSSIDELPQLINIIKGDMSIVGNRPLPLYEAEQLTTDHWALRFNAPAGLTGLWQVSKRGKSKMSENERKELDNEYALKPSMWNDVKLILKTVPALFQKENV